MRTRSRVAGLRPRGEVVCVIERAKEEFVVTLKRQGNNWFGLPADIKFYRPIVLTKVPDNAVENAIQRETAAGFKLKVCIGTDSQVKGQETEFAQ